MGGAPPARTGLGGVAHEEVIATGGHRQQGVGRLTGQGATARATGEVHFHLRRQLLGQAQGIALGVGPALGAALAAGTGDQPGQGRGGIGDQLQGGQSGEQLGGLVDRYIGQQQALPWGEVQVAIAVVFGQVGDCL